MCTIAILLGVAEVPLVLAANRDELYARPTRAPEAIAPGIDRVAAPPFGGAARSGRAGPIVGGIDEVSGGMWLAVDARGKFTAVTNQRVAAPPSGPVRSRGLVVRELALADDGDAYVAALDPRAYASMNLVWGDVTGARVAYLRHDGDKQIAELGRGVHVLCNDRLGSPAFPRAERFARAVEPSLGAPLPRLLAALAGALADHTETIAGSPLSATCIHTPAYGTRSATIAALSHGVVHAYLHAEGPPCTTSFVDRRELFGG